MSFQSRVQKWMMVCFGEMIAGDREERNHRFFEEATELVQACGMTKEAAHELVDYTYNRPAGEPYQEVGGVKVTLAALCLANGLNEETDGETELARIWTKVEQIRAKQLTKPKHSPLPQHVAPCDHKDGVTPHYDYVTCDSCGAVSTDGGWGIASRQWFPSKAAAKFYQQNGRMPEPREPT